MRTKRWLVIDIHDAAFDIGRYAHDVDHASIYVHDPSLFLKPQHYWRGGFARWKTFLRILHWHQRQADYDIHIAFLTKQSHEDEFTRFVLDESEGVGGYVSTLDDDEQARVASFVPAVAGRPKALLRTGSVVSYQGQYYYLAEIFDWVEANKRFAHINPEKFSADLEAERERLNIPASLFSVLAPTEYFATQKVTIQFHRDVKAGYKRRGASAVEVMGLLRQHFPSTALDTIDEEEGDSLREESQIASETESEAQEQRPILIGSLPEREQTFDVVLKSPSSKTATLYDQHNYREANRAQTKQHIAQLHTDVLAQCGLPQPVLDLYQALSLVQQVCDDYRPYFNSRLKSCFAKPSSLRMAQFAWLEYVADNTGADVDPKQLYGALYWLRREIAKESYSTAFLFAPGSYMLKALDEALSELDFTESQQHDMLKSFADVTVVDSDFPAVLKSKLTPYQSENIQILLKQEQEYMESVDTVMQTIA